MSNYTEQFTRAFVQRAAWDMAEKNRRSIDLRTARTRMKEEAAALSSGEVEEPSDFQQALQAHIDEITPQFDGLMEAMSRPEDSDAIREAAAVLIGGIAGRALALEMRVQLLEAAADG